MVINFSLNARARSEPEFGVLGVLPSDEPGVRELDALDDDRARLAKLGEVNCTAESGTAG